MYTKDRFKKLAGLLTEDCELHHDKLDVVHDNEGAMAKGQLEQIVSQASMLLAKMPEEAQMESWVQSKITTAKELVDTVFHYLVDEIPDEQPELGEGKEFDDSFKEFEKQKKGKENLLDLDEPFKNEASMDDEIGRWYAMKDEKKRKAAEKLEKAMESGDKAEIKKAEEEYEKAAYVGD